MKSLEGRLIVLGATGFVGGNVVARAQALGWDVLGLSSKDIDLTSPDSSATLSKLLRDGDTVVYGAAVVPARNVVDVIQNLLMTQHVVDGISGHEITQLVVISSDGVYGSQSGVYNEVTPCSPDTMHGLMNLARELTCKDVSTSIFTVVRPSAIYGVGDPHNSYGPNRFISQLLQKGEIEIFGEGVAVRDHVFIDDVADAIVRAIDAREAGVINIASGESISFAAIAELIRKERPDGSSIVVTGNESSPTFRSYDISNLVRLFPDFEPIPPAVGVRRVVAEAAGRLS
jgi:nucleoside-diphosphate-sugar epimerase